MSPVPERCAFHRSIIASGARVCAGALLLWGAAFGTPRASAQSAGAPDSGARQLAYPAARRSDQVNDYFGVQIADPYRWLEDTDSPETRAWIAAENRLTSSYLSAIPQRARIRERLTALWNYPKYGLPFRRGHALFFTENTGLQQQPVLYVQESEKSAPHVLLDPNTLSSDGTVALSVFAVSERGRYLGYGTQVSGSDWEELHVRDVRHGSDLPDTLRWVKFSQIAWTHDEKGFFYSRYDAPASDSALRGANRNQKVYYHRVGTPQERDVLIYESPGHPDWLVTAETSDDGEYVLLTVRDGTDRRNRLYYIDLGSARSPKVNNPVVRLLDEGNASYRFVDNGGQVFYVQTDLDAPNGRLVAIDINRRERRFWRTVIPEDTDVLEQVHVIDNRLIATYLHDAHSLVRFFEVGGAPSGELPLPGMGTVGGPSGRPTDTEMYYSFTSFLQPPAVYRYDLEHDSATLWRAPQLAFDTSRYETRQLFFTSKDGTRVPMFITARKNLALDGTHPTLLSAYGGFGVSVTPTFSPAQLVWLEMGGIYAVANVRGGGEYGEEWHHAGMLDRKQNVFDDFIAAAEYLVREKYTSPSHLAMQGASNGGLLVGAVMTQRPDLFAAALPAVGVMDMLRFQKFTIGWAWVSEYGSSDDSAQFEVLRRYSPLHNIHAGTRYPATLVTTADHDDRVVPGHSFKFAAALQAAQSGSAPVLIRIESKAGHGGGTPTDKRIDESTDALAFLVRVLGMP
ncbi:MAG TPA: prolyl oligopeptidase family serine peptidase [Gemmatimonadaceae bacterium]|nr:prolyl oligopeptidase family serine peptidase [Gemmatimonadaceae bacterium]